MRKKEIKILYEDEDVVVIDKPAGFLTHPDGKTDNSSISEWFAEKYPESVDVGEDAVLEGGKIIKRPGIVHRLDKDTSGVLILAKNKIAHGFFKKQFDKKTIRKTYIAFVWGEMKKDEGLINLPIGQSKGDFRKKTTGRGIKGEEREAITRFRVQKKSKNFSLVNVFPETGRTHQIRVHFKAINHPVVCDPLYGKKDGCALGFKRLALHAFRIEFPKIDGQKENVEAPLPNDFRKAIAEFEELA